MNNANFSPSFLIPFRVLLRCPLCNGAFSTHMEFMTHVRTTHPSRSEQNIILCSHVYAFNTLNPENSSSSQPAAPQHASSQNVIVRSSMYPSATLLLENLPSAQPATPRHASPQNVILSSPVYPSATLLLGNQSSVQHAASQNASPQNVILSSSIYGFGTLFSGNSPSPQPAAPRPLSLQRNNNVVILPTSSSNSGRAPPIDWQQMARTNRVGGLNSTFVDSNESITGGTRPLINQLDVPTSSNANELGNIAGEQNDLDLNLRL